MKSGKHEEGRGSYGRKDSKPCPPHVFHDFMSSCQNRSATPTTMTPMKALPMLDHVMLWVARLYVAALFVFVCATEHPAIIPHFFILIVGFALWRLTYRSWRLFLAITSTLGLIILLLTALIAICHTDPYTLGSSLGFNLFGFFCILWTSCRTSTKAKPTVQTASPNLVNPV